MINGMKQKMENFNLNVIKNKDKLIKGNREIDTQIDCTVY